MDEKTEIQLLKEEVVFLQLENETLKERLFAGARKYGDEGYAPLSIKEQKT